ncbi:hypothetical protein Dimus_001355, partial [Dionaea muscipula]
IPHTSHSSGRGRGRSLTDRGGNHTSIPSAGPSSSTSVERDDYIDDYRTVDLHESTPTDSSYMASPEHPPTSSSGPPELFLDGVG